MVKKGPLGKAEEFYIQEKHKTMSLNEICDELDRAKTLVKRCISKCKKVEKEEAEKAFSAGSQFGVRNGSVVMTPNAAQMSDEFIGSTTITSRQSNCITGTGKKNGQK